ncbi:MAG TPA: adenosylmethionine decarboxylase [Anaerolineae bacterium]|nr:adenosylmethionine decarboxylase [Anaerolineae bacterium]
MAIDGRHCLYDMWLAERYLVAGVDFWREVLREAAAVGGATIVGEGFHPFEPMGVTGYLLLAESHISVHTWPEEGLAAMDIFTCGPMDLEGMIGYLRQKLEPHDEKLEMVLRGKRGK